MKTQRGSGQRPSVGGMETPGVRRPTKKKMRAGRSGNIGRWQCHL